MSSVGIGVGKRVWRIRFVGVRSLARWGYGGSVIERFLLYGVGRNGCDGHFLRQIACLRVRCRWHWMHGMLSKVRVYRGEVAQVPRVLRYVCHGRLCVHLLGLRDGRN